MKRLLPLTLIVSLFLSASLYGQVVPPPQPGPVPAPKPVVVTAIVPLTVTAKSGELIIIDAKAAKGEVKFSYDKKVFGLKQAITVGKALILAPPANKETKTYQVTVTSWEDRTQDDVVITVTGEAPTPPDPGPTPSNDSLLKLRAEMLAGFKEIVKYQTETRADISSLKDRITALEGSKPPPVPVPVPTPDDPLTKALFGAWQQEFATDKKDSAAKMSQCYEAASNAVASAVTWGDVMKKLSSESSRLMINGKLPVLARAINDHLLASGFSASPSVLIEAADKDKTKATLLKVSNALKTLP